MSNGYCDHLGIAVPSLAAVRTHREANTFTLLIVSLLEHGHPMTLEEVASHFAAAGVFEHAKDALTSLKRCRPARPPVYRDDDRYTLDPHDEVLDLWVFRLGLRPPKVSRPEPSPPSPRPPTTQRLSIEELDQAWRNDANLYSWSQQRLVLAILDAHDRAMSPEEVVAFVSARTKLFRLAADTVAFQRKSSAIAVDSEGRWTIAPDVPELGMARNAVRDAVEIARRWARPSSEERAASMRAFEKQRTAHADELTALRRVIVHAFPARAPEAVVLLDINARSLTTLVGDELSQLDTRLRSFDMFCGVDIRTTLRLLGFDPGDRRLGELGPPQKSVQTPSGVIKLTTAMFIVGSCRIRNPLATDKQLGAYLSRGQRDQLAARLGADAQALFAMYQYGMLHGAVRLRRGQLDEMFSAPWHHSDEPSLYQLLREAFEHEMGLVAVVGDVPSWTNPWSGAQHLQVVQGRSEYDLLLYDEWGRWIDDREVQLARLEATIN